MENLMNKYNLKYEFIEAVDGGQFSKEESKKYLSPIKPLLKIGRFMVAGDVGCILSHVKCWKKMERENIKELVVLEDDIFFNEKFANLLEYREKFPSDWEFINFCTPARSVIWGKEKIFDMYSFTKFIEPHQWTTAYAITLEGARKNLQSCQPPFECPIDHITGEDLITGIVSYGISPNIVILEEKFGTETKDRNKKHNPIYNLWRIVFYRFIAMPKYYLKVLRIKKKLARELQALQSKA